MPKDQKVTLGFKLSDGSEQQVTFTVPAGKDGDGDLNNADFSHSTLVTPPDSDAVNFNEITLDDANAQIRDLALNHKNCVAVAFNNVTVTSNSQTWKGASRARNSYLIGNMAVFVDREPYAMGNIQGHIITIGPLNTKTSMPVLYGDGISGFGTTAAPFAVDLSTHEDQTLSIADGKLFSPRPRPLRFSGTIKNDSTRSHQGVHLYENKPYVELDVRITYQALTDQGVQASRWQLIYARIETPKTPGVLDFNGEFQALPYSIRQSYDINADFSLCFERMPTHMLDPGSGEVTELVQTTGSADVGLSEADTPVELPYQVDLLFIPHLAYDRA